MSEFKFPTEVVELPSKGLIYPQDHILRSGKVEMKYMTAKEEDILSNQNFIEKGIVLDKLLESLTLGKFNIKDLHAGDKNAIFVAARILGYGKDYEFVYKGKKYNVDLSQIENKNFDSSIVDEKGYGTFTLPQTENVIKFKFLNETDNSKIEEEIKGFEKINKDNSRSITTKLIYTIVSINGDSDKTNIRGFVENQLLASDSRALRKYVNDVSPDVNLTFTTESGEEAALPIGLTFFWPDI
jgi:hypothetical protein